MQKSDATQVILKILQQAEDSGDKTHRSYGPRELGGAFDLAPSKHGQRLVEIEQFVSDYMKFSSPTQSKAFMNQLWSQVEPSSLVGEVLAAVTNTSMYTYEVAPLATLLEQSLVKHLSSKVWGEAGDGVMTSGGTASNLQALMIARNERLQESKEHGLSGGVKKPYILASKEAHYSIKRACNILGLGHAGLIEVEADSDGRMMGSAVESAIAEVEKLAGHVVAVVATAGTTVKGAFDDILGIGEVCKRQKVWFHVDGAYGASVLLSESHRDLMQGGSLADSVSWDFHKMLGLHLPAAFVFVRKKGLLKKSLASGNDDYLFHDEDDLDLGPKSLQCGRRADVVKLWLSWMAQGERGFSERIDGLFNAASVMRDLIEKDHNFVLVAKPQSINVCFRYNSPDGIRHEKSIRTRMLEEGSAILNYSEDSQGPFFRLAITRPDLTTSDLRGLLDLISTIGGEYASTSRSRPQLR